MQLISCFNFHISLFGVAWLVIIEQLFFEKNTSSIDNFSKLGDIYI